jgi:hypothetical protein
VFVALGAAVCAVIALCLAKLRKMPKVAAVFAFGAGGGIGGWLGGFIGGALGWIDSLAAQVVGASVMVLVVLALGIFVVHDLMPKNKASGRTVWMAFGWAILLGLTAGAGASAMNRLSDGIGEVAQSAITSTF